MVEAMDSTGANTAASSPSTSPSSSSTPQRRRPAPDGRIYFSYAQVHEVISNLASSKLSAWRPDVILAIGGGGFIPARMMRTTLGKPIVAISLELYNDDTRSVNDGGVKTRQWLDEGSIPLVEGRRVLIVDEVDDSRATLEHCVAELRARHAPSAVAVAVLHNKLKAKKGVLPDDVDYFAGEDVDDVWNCYPWDAESYGRNIVECERLAQFCAGSDAEGTDGSASA